MSEAAPEGERPGLLIARAAHDLVKAGQDGLAREAVELALRVEPGLANAHTVKAHLLEREGEFAGALAHWREAARLLPDSVGHRFNLALALLCAREFAEGFALQEARLGKPDWSSFAAAGSFAGLRHHMPRAGEDLSGKRVLAFTEQGLGDMIWAARFLPALAARCGTLDLACPPTLAPLLRGLVSGETLGPPAEAPQAKINMAALVGRYDRLLPMMSLPHVLGTHAANGEWLKPDPARVAHWRGRYRAALGERRLVGVVWRANPANKSAPARTMPPAVLAGLGDLGVIDLQGGEGEGREALAAALPGRFDPLAGGMAPLDDFAAMIAATDVLVTIDTMAAHLAGAMGHPALVAIGGVPSFYAGREGERSQWYASWRQVRQTPAEGREGDWRRVGAAMAAMARG